MAKKSVRDKIKEVLDTLVDRGDHLICGASGGADSTCLLLELYELSGELDFTLSVVHVEHGLRGEESLSDAAFTEELCRRRGIPFHLYHVDVKAYATKERLSDEEAARKLRRACYRRAAALYADDPVKIVLAHQMEDQAETVLLALIRGTGLKGMGGMRALAPLDEDGELTILRPLLGVTRAEIEEELSGRGQPFCEDRTNATDAYTRNILRHHILPQLTAINPGAVRHIAHTAELLQQAEEELVAKGDDAYGGCIIGGRLHRTRTRALSGEMQGRLIRAWMYDKLHTRRDISAKHIEAVRALLGEERGATELPGDYRARISGAYIIWEKKQKEPPKEPQFTETPLPRMETGDCVQVSFTGYDMRFSLEEIKSNPDLSEKRYAKCFDYDKIGSIVIRGRKEGDFLAISTDGATKSLRRYMIDEKIPAEERANIPLLCDGAGVIWVVGYRDSMAYRLSDTTRRVLKVDVIKNGGRYE